MHRALPLAVAAVLCLGTAFYASRLSSRAAVVTDFTHFESAHVHPAALSPDGSRLFVVNTPDMRLSVFSLASGAPVLEQEIPVGIEPVSVTARSDGEVWVVNSVSDDISIVDVAAGNVVRTLRVGDEPTDVAFAGGGLAFVCVSGEDAVKVYDPADLSAPPTVIDVGGRKPRALAADAARSQVYVTVMNAGNRTTVIPFQEVQAGGGPPPAVPSPDPALPDSPRVALIVKRQGGAWVDEIGRNWNAAAPYTVTDWGLAVIDAGARTVAGRAGGVGTVNFNAAWNPANGRVYVTNTEALNQVRFEPNLEGRFVRNRVSIVDPANPAAVDTVHLNAHVNYAVSPGPATEIDQSLAQPLDIAWNAAGTRAYLAAFGSGLVGVIDAAGAVVGRIAVGGGPSGVAVDEGRGALYVVNRFDNTLSVVDLAAAQQTGVLPIGRSGFDPTPEDVRAGRRFQYDARLTSAHGDVSCASCHVFTHHDNIAWDLGDPRGRFISPNDPEFPSGQIDPFLEGFHPMKGPMVTQSLRGLEGSGLLHWRGDRLDLSRFNPAFESLLGNDRPLTGAELAQYEAFVMSVRYPSNPRQNLDRTYRDAPPGQPSAQRGFNTFMNDPHDGPLRCVQCHTLPTGGNGQIINDQALLEDQDIEVPQLRGLYEKSGFRDSAGAVNRRGFGFTHDGAIDNLFTFLKLPVFQFADDAQRRDMEAFLLSFDTGTAPAVGLQVTVSGANRGTPAVQQRLDLLVAQFQAGNADLIARGLVNGEARGYVLEADGLFRSDRLAEAPLSPAALRDLAADGGEITWTGVPPGAGVRAGVDRDRDGARDRDELDAGSDPANPLSTPGTVAAAGTPAPRLAFAGASPNPFRVGTRLGFTLPQAGRVRLALYDVRGRELRLLADGAWKAGSHALPFDGRDARGARLGAGVYFARLEFEGRVLRRPVVLLP